MCNNIYFVCKERLKGQSPFLIVFICEPALPFILAMSSIITCSEMSDGNDDKEGKNKAGIHQTQFSSCPRAVGTCAFAMFLCRHAMICRFVTSFNSSAWKRLQLSFCLFGQQCWNRNSRSRGSCEKSDCFGPLAILVLVNSSPLCHCSGETGC